MNSASLGVGKRMPKATALHKQLQEAKTMLSCGFAQTSCAPVLPAVLLPLSEHGSSPVQMSDRHIICPMTHVGFVYGA